jgi:hypothetical protein
MTDARQRYLSIVLPIVKDGHGRIAEAERALLNRQRDCLNLSPAEAEAIEQRVLDAYQTFLHRQLQKTQPSEHASQATSSDATPASEAEIPSEQLQLEQLQAEDALDDRESDPWINDDWVNEEWSDSEQGNFDRVDLDWDESEQYDFSQNDSEQYDLDQYESNRVASEQDYPDQQDYLAQYGSNQDYSDWGRTDQVEAQFGDNEDLPNDNDIDEIRDIDETSDYDFNFGAYDVPHSETDNTFNALDVDQNADLNEDLDYPTRLQHYKQELGKIMRSGQPIDAPLRKGLRGLQQIYHLREDDVQRVEAELAMELRDVEESSYQQRRYQYQQAFAHALAADRLTQDSTQAELEQLQQDLQLSPAEVIQLERQVYAHFAQVLANPASANVAAAAPAATQLPEPPSEPLPPTELQDSQSRLSVDHPPAQPVDQPISFPSYYTNLRNALAQANWQAADQETLNLMLKLAKRETEGWLDALAIEQFPCRDLERIDRLWHQASRGKFSFSKQLEIYTSPVTTPKARFLKFHSDEYERALVFSEEVGWWRSGAEFYKYYRQLNFSLQAPLGQFPALWFWRIPWWVALQFGGLGNDRGGCRVDPQTIAVLMERLQLCKQQNQQHANQQTNAFSETAQSSHSDISVERSDAGQFGSRQFESEHSESQRSATSEVGAVDPSRDLPPTELTRPTDGLDPRY